MSRSQKTFHFKRYFRKGTKRGDIGEFKCKGKNKGTRKSCNDCIKIEA